MRRKDMLKPITEMLSGFDNLKLKPCPFCGSQAEFLIETHENGDTTQTHEIQCMNRFCCGARMSEPISGWQNDYIEEVHGLIDRWNTRKTKVRPIKREKGQ